MKVIIEKPERTSRLPGLNISRSTWKALALTGLICILFLITILIVSISFNIPVGNFTRDPLQVVNSPFYTGLVSNIGILFWCAAAVICLYSYSLSLKTTKDASFLLFSGILTLFLMADDFFLLHEVVYRNYLHIPSKIIFLLYLVTAISLFYSFRYVILKTEYMILFIAILMLSLSGIIDAIPQNILPVHHLFEDGTKFSGIVFWFLYFLRSGSYLLNKS